VERSIEGQKWVDGLKVAPCDHRSLSDGPTANSTDQGSSTSAAPIDLLPTIPAWLAERRTLKKRLTDESLNHLLWESMPGPDRELFSVWRMRNEHPYATVSAWTIPESCKRLTSDRGQQSILSTATPRRRSGLRQIAKEQGQEFAAEFREIPADRRSRLLSPPRPSCQQRDARTWKRSMRSAKPPNNFVLYTHWTSR